MIRAILIAGVVSSLAGIASAEETYKWADVENWQVRVDPSMGHGCFVIGTWEAGTVLRIGFSPLEGTFQFVLGDDRWKSLEWGKKYNLSIQFGRLDPWEAEATGVHFGDSETVFLSTESSDAEFLKEFMEHVDMKVSYQDQVIAVMNLPGSYRAMMEVMECQREMKGYATPKADPFAGPAVNSSDPFAN